MATMEINTRDSLNNILFATDFSESSNAALPYAETIAREFGSKIFLAHVLAPAGYAYVPPAAWNALAEEDEKGARAKLADLGAKLGDIPCESLLCRGEVWFALENLVKKYGIDLIVIGTHGRTGVGKLLMGSVAEEIFRQAACPVLTVGPNVQVDPRQAIRMREILYATDLNPESRPAAPYAISLAQEHEAHLSLLHVLPKSAVGDLVHPEQHVDSTLRMLHNLVPPEAELWCKPEAFVKSG